MWPSLGCIFCCCGVWLIAQSKLVIATVFTYYRLNDCIVGHKTHCCRFHQVLGPFYVIFIISLFLLLVSGGDLIWLLFPFAYAVIAQLWLRIHMTLRHDASVGILRVVWEGLLGLICCPCSIAQMSRSLYGYTKFWDGDSDPELDERHARNVQ